MIEVKSATVITNRTGPDVVYIGTNLPNGEYPFVGNAMLKVNVASGKGG